MHFLRQEKKMIKKICITQKTFCFDENLPINFLTKSITCTHLFLLEMKLPTIYPRLIVHVFQLIDYEKDICQK